MTDATGPTSASTPSSSSASDTPLAVWAAVVAFGTWGLLVIYWKLLESVDALEILCYRIVFSLVLLGPVLVLTHRWHEVTTALRSMSVVLRMVASTAAISVNWYAYIWAVNDGRVLEASLGSFIVPLVNVVCGCLLLGDRPSRLQWFCIALAAGGVSVSVLSYGSVPWVALIQAASFAGYGLIRKTVKVDSLPGLFIEIVLLSPLAFGWIGWLYVQGQGVLAGFVQGSEGWGLMALLAISGPLTVVPLICFAYAARHMRLTTLGLIQYATPTCTFLLGVFAFHEPLALPMLVTFICIWIALALFSWEMWRVAQRRPAVHSS